MKTQGKFSSKNSAAADNTFSSSLHIKQKLVLAAGITSIVALSIGTLATQADNSTVIRSEQPESNSAIELTFDEPAPSEATESIVTPDVKTSVPQSQARIQSSGDVAPDVSINGQKIDVPANGTVDVPMEPAPTQSSNESNSSFSINIQTSGDAEVDEDVSSNVEIRTDNDIRIRTRNR